MSTEQRDYPSDESDGGLNARLTRRDALVRAGGAGFAITGAAALLAACGGSSGGGSSSGGGTGSTTAVSTPGVHGLSELAGGSPRRGGTFTAGVISNGSEENLFPGTSGSTPDYIRVYNLYNLLFYCDRNLVPIQPGLALSAESNSDGTLWTFRLRDGVRWHDGSDFTADDVVYNFKALWSNPALNYTSGFLIGLVDFKGVRKLDRLTVQIPLLKPSAQFPSIFTFYNFPVVKNGATKASTAKKPIGTGPFKYVSFTPGSRSVFDRNPDYWEGAGKPYVDQLIVDSSFTDNTALSNALLDGQINLVPSIELLTAKNQLTQKQVQILEASIPGIQYMFAMRVDTGQFKDNRVREAFKLVADRQALVDGTFAGFGTPGNDLLAPGSEYFLTDQKRTTDVEKAKSLIKQAGMQDHKFVLPAAEAYPGMVEGATLFAQQAQAAGINVVVQQTSASTYFTPAQGVFVRSFGIEVDQVVPSLTCDYMGELTANCPFPDTHWGKQAGGASKSKLINQALGEVDKTKAAELWRECQLQQYNEGGYLAWGNVPFVDAAANNIRGLKSGAGFSYNNWRLCDGWIES